MGRPPRVDAPGVAFFVTTTTFRRRPLLTRDPVARAVVETLAELRGRGELELAAYVLMPDHMHLILRPLHGSLSDVMRRLKSLAWHRCRQRAGLQGRLWQDGFFDEGIRSRRQLARQIAYVHANPVRAGFVEAPGDWPWSSAGAYEAGDAPVEVDVWGW